MTKEEQELKVTEVAEFLKYLETPGGVQMLKLITETIESIPADVTGYIGVSSDGMRYDETRAVFSAGGKTYLQEILKRVDDMNEFIKRVAEEKSVQQPENSV